MTVYVINSLADDLVSASAVPDGTLTLREAIIAANTDAAFGDAPAGTGADQIVFAPGLSGTITLTLGALDVLDTLSISGDSDGDGVDDVTIDAAASGRIFNVSSDFTISDLTLTGGAVVDDNGGAILQTGGELEVDNVTFDANQATGMGASGGAISAEGSRLTVSDSTFTNNTSERAGGAIEVDGATNVNINESTFEMNDTTGGAGGPGNGGAFHITGGSGTITFIENSVFGENTAASEGGALWNSADGSMNVSESNIAENVASGDASDNGGGGIFNDGGSLRIFSTDIRLNSADGAAGSGGGILSVDGAVIVDGTTLGLNEAARAGGGIEIIDGSLDIDGSSFVSNGAGTGGVTAAPGNGGGIHVSGMSGTLVDVDDTTFRLNTAASEGGALWNQSGSTMNVGNVVIADNTASGDAADNGGGGIFNNGGTLIVRDTNLSFNDANGTAGSGGGIFSTDGNVTVFVSTFVGNTATRAGGGIEVVEGNTDVFGSVFGGNSTGGSPGNGGAFHRTGTGTSLFTDSSFFSNFASAEGGALWNSATGTLAVNNGIIADNSASGADADQGGGGIFNDGGTLTVNGTTLRNNTANGASGSGGGILTADGTVTLADAVLQGNDAQRAGGGLEIITGDVTVTNSAFLGNSTGAAPGNGGGIHVTDDATTGIAGSTFTSNTAANEGGAVWNSATGTMTVTDSTLADNEAAIGGGAFQVNGGTLAITDSQVVGNSAPVGSGVATDGPSMSMGSVTIDSTVLGDDRVVLTGRTDDAVAGDSAANLVFAGGGSDVLNGGGGGDALFGEGGFDTLNGGGGADRLAGGADADTLSGGAGDDTIIGGFGADQLTGGAGRDTFVFNVANESVATARDRINDFEQGLDVIDLSGVDAVLGTPANEAFTYIGGNVFSGTAGELRAFGLLVQGDRNGDGVADFEFSTAAPVTFTADDFVL